MPDSATPKKDFALDHKVLFLNSVFLFAGVIAFGMGFYRWQESVLMGVIDFIFALSNFCLVYYLNRHKQQVETISSIAIALAFILFTALYLLAPYNTTRISLFFLLSASIFYLKGRQTGFLWLGILLLTMVIGHFLPGIRTGYSHFDLLSACLYLVALFFIIRNYEIFNEKVNERNREQEVLRLSEERFRVLVESGNDVICILSATGIIRFVSPSISRVLGYFPNEIVGKHFNALLPPQEHAKAAEALSNALKRLDGLELEKYEFLVNHKAGGQRNIEIVGRNLIGHAVIDGIVLSCRDITERKQSEERMRLTARVFETAQEGITITDMRGDIIEVNEAFCRITGYSREELLGRNPRLLQSGHQSRSFYEEMWRDILQNGTWAGEVWNRKKSGEVYPEWLTITSIADENGSTTHYVGISSDITVLKQHEKQLERIAHYDALTGIPNRSLLGDRMKQAIARTAREQNMMAVCYLDLDGFKPINDTMGHEAGDRVLIEIAQRIQHTIRGGDTVARLGGDEFVILLLGQERGEECSATLERLLSVIAEPITIMGKSFELSASIGVSIYPLDDEDPDTLLRHADQAMYIAKQTGKNRFHIYDPALDQRARDQQDLLKRIQQGLQGDEFELYYQPKVDLRTQRLVGAEALIRWNHPELGLLSPAKFLPAVENTDLDIALGEWVIATALKQIERWRTDSLAIEVSINISAHHLESARFVEQLQEHLARHPGLPPSCLQIEVLETAALEDIGHVSRIIESCKQIGIGFALDDFGTGYSSLSYLSGLPVDALKIDQSFMRNLSMNKGDHAIVVGIIALSRAFELKVVAEGIETEAHYRTLLDMGCDLGQGFGIAKPMPASALTEWAMQNRNGTLAFPCFTHAARQHKG